MSGIIPENTCQIIFIESYSDQFKFENNNFCPPYPDCLVNQEPFTDENENGIWDEGEPFVDTNNNGIYEIAYGDSNEDGIIDTLAVDENENRKFEIVLFDTNGSGNPNEAEIDDDEDGKTDVIAYDFNEDGKWDKYENVG